MEQDYSDYNTEATQNQSIEAPQSRPKNYLVWSILVTILCFWPLGIPAIIYSIKVDKQWNEGDRAGAYDASKNARKFCVASMVMGIIIFMVFFFIGFYNGYTAARLGY